MTKILLAEDDNDMRRFLVKALETAGYSVQDYDNGMSAYRRLREEPFELLLTDIVMPEMLGTQVAAQIRMHRPSLPVLYMSGYAQPVLDTHRAVSSDMDILEKPFTQATLLTRVRDALSARETTTSHSSAR
jgi:two-component system cell cycle response regulator CpdR